MIFHLWLYEWKRMFKHPGLFLFVLIFPIAVLGIIGLLIYSLAQDELESVNIVVLDQDQTFETNALVEQLQSDETIEGDINFIQGDHALPYYLENPDQYAAIVEVPEGFTEQLRSGVNEKINVYLNDSLPFASNLAYLLLESGQDYISAAQTGVNTVHHFHIQNLEQADERQTWIQQMTLHFTYYALNRNSFFAEDDSTEQGLLSWTTHLYLMTVVILFFMTYLLMTLIFQPKHQHITQQRLSLISVKRVHQTLAIFFHQVSFTAFYLLALLWLLHQFVYPSVTFNVLIFIQWLLVGIVICLISFVMRSIFAQKTISNLLSLILSGVLLLASGLLIPPTYLPGSFQLLNQAYEGFAEIWIDHQMPLVNWLQVTLLILVVLSVVFFSMRRVGSSW
ncbi:ABC transporter permease [Tenuibacillus multivorans]|uniref:ABC-2 family transporter protein n=1 Tax=Tenuibacillus multivorans TaxID=237069 RepID=A0A1H0EWC1_9BACI|nr:ABC transporter permease [Tenuibacillus multivorans]GEL76931.1 hypothetical protein TMU01_11660 [Tenuibacillus multivorans]SDN86671.1 ABC-2 family transporter protein [Tenuibacillus multivorans]